MWWKNAKYIPHSFRFFFTFFSLLLLLFVPIDTRNFRSGYLTQHAVSGIHTKSTKIYVIFIHLAGWQNQQSSCRPQHTQQQQNVCTILNKTKNLFMHRSFFSHFRLIVFPERWYRMCVYAPRFSPHFTHKLRK